MGANSVLVVCGKMEMGREIVSLMLHNGYLSAELALSANEARRKLNLTQPELIIISAPIRDETISEFVFDISERYNSCIIVIVKREYLAETQYDLEKCGALVLSKPLEKITLVQTAKYAVIAKKSLSGLITENSKLKKKMDDKKVIDRAKWFLIENLSMTEPQAHRHIQKMAMDLRKPQVEVANDIINSYD